MTQGAGNDFNPGIKVALQNVPVRRGALILDNKCARLLGGKVESLLAAVNERNAKNRDDRNLNGSHVPSLLMPRNDITGNPSTSSSSAPVNNHHTDSGQLSNALHTRPDLASKPGKELQKSSFIKEPDAMSIVSGSSYQGEPEKKSPDQRQVIDLSGNDDERQAQTASLAVPKEVLSSTWSNPDAGYSPEEMSDDAMLSALLEAENRFKQEQASNKQLEQEMEWSSEIDTYGAYAYDTNVDDIDYNAFYGAKHSPQPQAFPDQRSDLADSSTAAKELLIRPGLCYLNQAINLPVKKQFYIRGVVLQLKRFKMTPTSSGKYAYEVLVELDDGISQARVHIDNTLCEAYLGMKAFCCQYDQNDKVRDLKYRFKGFSGLFLSQRVDRTDPDLHFVKDVNISLIALASQKELLKICSSTLDELENSAG